MEYQLNHLASLSYLDLQHDELKDEYGDLPSKIEETRILLDAQKHMVDETKTILETNKKFVTDAKVTLVDLKTKEEKLAKQQFKVKNNREFDAITHEIDFIRSEYNRLADELKTTALKEENLINMLDEQKKQLAELKKEMKELEEELSVISEGQDEEMKKILKIRKDLVKKLEPANYQQYERIRKYHDDVVVLIRRNSCSGCFSQIPHQKVVEIRNSLEEIFTCEHCGRIIYTEEITISEKVKEL
jgi:hypothetical protein